MINVGKKYTISWILWVCDLLTGSFWLLVWRGTFYTTKNQANGCDQPKILGFLLEHLAVRVQNIHVWSSGAKKARVWSSGVKLHTFTPQVVSAVFFRFQMQLVYIWLGVSKNNGSPKWTVKIMENPIIYIMDDLGVPLFLETSIYYIGIRVTPLPGWNPAKLKGFDPRNPWAWKYSNLGGDCYWVVGASWYVYVLFICKYIIYVYIYTPKMGEDEPIWGADFSNGLKPPPRYITNKFWYKQTKIMSIWPQVSFWVKCWGFPCKIYHQTPCHPPVVVHP